MATTPSDCATTAQRMMHLLTTTNPNSPKKKLVALCIASLLGPAAWAQTPAQVCDSIVGEIRKRPGHLGETMRGDFFQTRLVVPAGYEVLGHAPTELRVERNFELPDDIDPDEEDAETFAVAVRRYIAYFEFVDVPAALAAERDMVSALKGAGSALSFRYFIGMGEVRMLELRQRPGAKVVTLECVMDSLLRDSGQVRQPAR